jgi:phosphotransferase system enzyme I (PtsP)
LIRAAASRELRLMFPMIAEVAEFKAARAWLDKELKWEKELGFPPPSKFSVGAMLEVPSLVLQLPALLKQVDFISVGSNDLFQFLFASDRGNPQLSERYDLLSPLVLTLLRSVVEQCRTAGTPVSLCGDMASRPLEAMALIGAGFRDLSVTPSSVGPIKAMIRSLSVLALCEYMNSLYDLDQHDTRQKLGSFAQEHGVII